MSNTSLYRVKSSSLSKVPDYFHEDKSQWNQPFEKQHCELVEESWQPDMPHIALDHGMLRKLFEKAASGFLENSRVPGGYELDRWLAPRVHSAIRLPRRVAADPRVWSWIAVEFARTYTCQRWVGGKTEAPDVKRMIGPKGRNAVGRLWWAAELVRNGADYSNVDLVLNQAITAEFALELKYSRFRPAAIAYTQIATAKKNGKGVSQEEMEELTNRANAYLTTTLLEAIGFEQKEYPWDENWWTGSATTAELLDDEPVRGPTDGTVSPIAIDRARAWFNDTLEEIRKVKSQAATPSK